MTADPRNKPETTPPPSDAEEAKKKVHDDACVDEAGDETFPASDPPAWTPQDTGRPDH